MRKLLEAAKLARDVIADEYDTLIEQCDGKPDKDEAKQARRYKDALDALEDAIQAETPLYKVVTGLSD